MNRETLVRVSCQRFVAGLVARDGVVVEAAPILRRCIGMNGRQFFDLCKDLGWRIEVIEQ